MSVIRVVLHNNLISFGSPASTAFRSASRPTAVALTVAVELVRSMLRHRTMLRRRTMSRCKVDVEVG